MQSLTRILDAIDEAAGGFIRLAYLAAGITAVAVYFGAGHLPAGLEAALNGALPWALAAAVEVHTYVTARRVRAAWQDVQAAPSGSQEAHRAGGALRVNLGVLAGLLAFSCWNQLNYLASTWAPPVTALALPGWLAYVVRALVVPAAFMAAAFLAPLAEPITAQIESEARATLADVFKIARRQRRRMLVSAERDGRDMTSALVELVGDPETRRIIGHAYAAIAPALAGAIIPAMPANTVESAYSALPAAILAPEPTRAAPVRTPARKRSGKAGAKGGAIKLVQPSPESRVRAIWTPAASISDIEKQANVSRSTAHKWNRVLLSEQQQREEIAE
jgi:hypothetical protein